MDYEDEAEAMTFLCHLCKLHETDKGGGPHFRYAGGDSDTVHNYSPVYYRLFKDMRDEVLSVLEIGVHGGSSLRVWRDFFPNAHIVGLDTNAECLKHSEKRITVLMADQNNPRSIYDALAKLSPDTPPFSLIVDDGSHEREHQIVSLKALLPFLDPHGYYVVEDLGTGPRVNLLGLFEAVPPAYIAESVIIEGGHGPKVQPYEYLFVVRHRP